MMFLLVELFDDSYQTESTNNIVLEYTPLLAQFGQSASEASGSIFIVNPQYRHIPGLTESNDNSISSSSFTPS
jgi:hypothetical protein